MNETSAKSPSLPSGREPQQREYRRSHSRESKHSDIVVNVESFEGPSEPAINPVPYSSRQFPLGGGSPFHGPRRRPRSPGLKWYKNYDSPDSWKSGRVLVIDYVRQEQSKKGMRKVAAQELNSIQELRTFYSTPARIGEAVLRLIHCQNADWATRFLMRKFSINARDDIVGTDFGKYLKYKRPERRGNKPFLTGKTWKTIHDPWRGISRTSFGLEYLKHYPCPEPRDRPGEEEGPYKMFELNHYGEDDTPKYGFDAFVQRISCYVQHKEFFEEIPDSPDIQNPYSTVKNGANPNKYLLDIENLDNGNTIIIFDHSQTGSIEDTIIQARRQFESRWRRLPFYLGVESHDFSDDDSMVLECMKIILADIWKGIAENWEDFLDICGTHVSILEDKIYEGPADESRAPELWTNSSMWLKVERLVAIHLALVKEMQINLRELTGETDDNWLESSTPDMEKLSKLVQDGMVKPTANLADLMYKSVGIRDSRHSLALSTSMWRLSWITFIFLPLTFTASFFGMNVSLFQPTPPPNPPFPSIKYYFIATVPLMSLVLILWYTIKHSLATTRQTPYQRGIYEALFHNLATTYPRLWSREGPRENVRPKGRVERVKWAFVLRWMRPEKTVRARMHGEEGGVDDLGAWARFKRGLARRWTRQLQAFDEIHSSGASSITLEEGNVEDFEGVEGRSGRLFEKGGNVLQVPFAETLSVGQGGVRRREERVGRGSAGNSPSRNSGIMVEEEPSGWLKEFRRVGV